MNCLKIPTTMFVRSYARRAAALSGVGGRLKVLRNTGTNLEDLDPHDISQFESDFMNVAETHREFERQTLEAKDKLKKRITVSKYFKEVDPSFLTTMEKEEIRRLHRANPQEWTPERLSESFPALPENIRKVLRSNWIPNTVDKVLAFDNNVRVNWEKFRSGELVVRQALRDHLTKFKHRQVNLPDRDLIAEKVIPPRVELPKPKSTKFTSIVDKYVQQVEAPSDMPALGDGGSNEGRLSVSDGTGEEAPRTDRRAYTFSEFARAKLPELCKTSPEEGSALLDAYRRQIQARDQDEEVVPSSEAILNFRGARTKKGGEEYKEEEASLNWKEFADRRLREIYESGETEKAIGILDAYRHLQRKAKLRNKSEQPANIPKEKNALEREEPEQLAPKEPASIAQVSGLQVEASSKLSDTYNGLTTFIKERISKIDTLCEYAKTIKIPQKLYKPGMTYKIEDCYYDDDGEFLYRVPGLK